MEDATVVEKQPYQLPAVNHTKYPKIPSGKGKGRNWTHENSKWWVIQEKIDGSQLTFWKPLKFNEVADDWQSGPMEFFNRGKQKTPPFDMQFDRAIAALKTLESELTPGYIYHGEVVCRPRHNVIQYDRVPRFNFILYDVQDGTGRYHIHTMMVVHAKMLGLEHVPALWNNNPDRNPDASEKITPAEKVEELIAKMETGELQSCLGGRAEGVVIKHPFYRKDSRRPDDKTVEKATKLKSVCRRFKEEHHVKQEKLLPQPTEAILDEIVSWYPPQPWWRKAYQHLRDDGVIKEGDPLEQRNKDGGKLAVAVREDFLTEHGDQIKEILYAAFSQQIAKAISAGCSQWYRGPDPEDPDYDPNWADQYDVREVWMSNNNNK